MGNMSDWAKREVELAFKQEEIDDFGFDYVDGCYKSALKAYNSLCEDNHSGMSWEFTKNILNRLMNNLPLTPIEDKDFFVSDETLQWDNEYLKEHGLKSEMQCPRYFSLFRYEKLDGTIVYSDNNRYYCYDKYSSSGATWRNGLMRQVLDEIFPITMPYYPYIQKYQLECSESLFDEKNGDFDTLALWSIETPADTKVKVNRFWKVTDDGWKEIDFDEWRARNTSQILFTEENSLTEN